MLRLFSLPDREILGIRCQMTARSARTFRAKEGIIFLRQEMGVRKIKRKATYTANGQSSAKLYPAAKPIFYYPLFLLPSSLFGKEL